MEAPESKISERQRQILFAVIEQYAEIPQPVGSVTLAKLFGVSSATVRNEMATLEEIGLLKQEHSSSGRIPTDAGYRIYVNAISSGEVKKQAPKRSAEAIDARIDANLTTADRAIRGAVDSLVEATGNLGVATIGNQLYLSGLNRLFGQFLQIENAREVAKLLDDLEPWLKEATPNEPLNVYIGSENPIGSRAGATLIISKFRSPFSDNSYIGLIGSTRQNYARSMWLVQNVGQVLEEKLGPKREPKMLAVGK
jgi:heat-inducible transcriptional repressor